MTAAPADARCRAVGRLHDAQRRLHARSCRRRTTSTPPRSGRLVEREQAQSVVVVGDAMARPLLEELKRGDYDASSLFVLGNGGAALSAAIKEEYLELLPSLLINDSLGSSETGAQASHLSAKDAVQTGKFNPGPGATVVSEDLSHGARRRARGHRLAGPVRARCRSATSATRPRPPGRSRPSRACATRCPATGRSAGRTARSTCWAATRSASTPAARRSSSRRSSRRSSRTPTCTDVLVCGRPSERWGNEVVAVVQLVEGATVDRGRPVRPRRATSVARYKLPKAWLFVDQVVRSPSGKADYRWAKGLAETSVG